MSQVNSEAALYIEEDNSKNVLGFWVYLMTDCLLFASLFATFFVLRNNTFGGPSGKELFSLPYVLAETMLLLTSSFTCGLALLAARQNKKELVLKILGLTFILGAAFLTLELREFKHLYDVGNSWRRSGFLSSFFTLVGTHGLHIMVGLLWLAILGWKIRIGGIKSNLLHKLTLFSIFWHFLDVVWVFIFTVVYLMGAL